MAHVKPLSIPGAFVFTANVHGDRRGSFHEWFREAELTESTGHRFGLAQANCSVSARGVLRGVHFADVPPGQAKYVTCVRGAILDVIVDLRVGSPTFAQWESVRLGEDTPGAVYLAEGLGHAFMALSDDATVVYLCSEPYNPSREHGIHPLDPELGIRWPADVSPILSDKDAAAPSLAEMRDGGLLPDYQTCLRYYEELARRTAP